MLDQLDDESLIRLKTLLQNSDNDYLKALDKTLKTKAGTLDAVPELIGRKALFRRMDKEGTMVYVGTGPEYDHFLVIFLKAPYNKRYKVKSGAIRINKRIPITSNMWRWGKSKKSETSGTETVYHFVREENAEQRLKARVDDAWSNSGKVKKTRNDGKSALK